MKHLLCIFSLFIITHAGLQAQLRLPAIIGSNMVLQQNDSAALWGWSGPSDKIIVTTSWNNHRDSTITSSGARWKIKVKTPAAGGPYTITLTTHGKSTILQNVMIGEVWVCSGQSNMEWSYNNGEKDTRNEIATAATNNIHFFHIPKTTSETKQDDVRAEWTTCDSNTLKSFSAVGYFFGKRLQQQLNVPIGLINSSWGGTPAETWTPDELVEQDATLKAAAAKINPAAWWPTTAGIAYNAMIAPVTDFAIAGAIWYQGESNSGTNASYSQLLTTMIHAWRSDWKKDFPFYYVQIAPNKYGNNNVGALLQEAQTKTMSYPNTGMVVITDLIDSVTNIHPSHKLQVGNRLANWALAETYHQTGFAYKSPMFKAAAPVKNTLVLSFNNVPTTLQAKDKTITGFFVSADTENWLPAEVKIDKDKIIVWNKTIKQPAYVRYSFSNTLVGNVSSAEGLPLTPFRSDNWAVDQSPVGK